jgi:hypothetical protein
MPQPTPKPAGPAGRPEAPPEEAFWQRYSPHHEFPLGTASAVGLFGAAVGLLIVASVLVNLSRHDERREPPKMDVVEEAQGGGGTGGFGPEGAGPDATGKESKVENVQPQKPVREKDSKAPQVTQAFKTPLPKQELKVPVVPPDTKETETGQEQIAAVVTQAQAMEEKARKDVAKAMKAAQGRKGVVNPGEGGGSGGGSGGGVGNKKGPGAGTSPTGVVRTKQERRGFRWRIDFSGTAEQHLAKLRALGITLAVPTGIPGRFFVMDLNRTPPTRTMTDLSRQMNKVKWFNTKAESVRELARVLGLPTVPPYVVIFLPQKMEQELADLEQSYKGLNENQIELTEFEIRQRPDGSYGPVVIRQVPKRR